MTWRLLHRWLGLVLGSVALVLAATGMTLALDPVRGAWQAPSLAPGLSVAELADRAAAHAPGIEEIRRFPSGQIVVYGFDGNQARATRVDPANGMALGDYRPSATPRWVKNLHRSLLLGDGGRIAAAALALALLLISVSGLVLMARRLGGWARLGARVRGTPLQRVHVVAGRAAVALLLLTSTTALYLSAATFSLIPSGAGPEPDVVSSAAGPELAASALPLLRELPARELRTLSFPSAGDSQDTWRVQTDRGQGWIDRHDGRTLAWQATPAAQRLHDGVMLLHTGEGAWPWALALGALGASIVLFWVTGILLWLQRRRAALRLAGNSAPAQAGVLIFVASESGSTWGFAAALQRAFVARGERVHSAALDRFQVPPAAHHVFVLAATYGDGQAPAHAARALQLIAAQPKTDAAVTVLGFGERQFPAFCAFAEALDRALRARGWRMLLPLERIDRQSPQQFARWGGALSGALGGRPLALDYRPQIPATHAITLVSREDFPGGAGEPAAILRFGLPRPSRMSRLFGRGLGRFRPGDLLALLAPGTVVPRYYSLASGRSDGFLEICVRRLPGGTCSTHLHGLEPGATVHAFIKPNPGFALERTRQPALLIGAGTGIAPLAGFVRGNRRRQPMHLYFGARDPERDFYFGRELKAWLGERRLASLHPVFSRIRDGGGYVQHALARDAERVRALASQGAVVRVCGSRPMAHSVAETLDGILGSIGLSVQQLRTGGRYAEDVF